MGGPVEPSPPQAAEVFELWRKAFTAYARQLSPVIKALAKTFEAYAQALQQAGLADEDGKPVRQSDRPAWQSPYGPPTTKRRK